MKPEDINKITDIARAMILDCGSTIPALFVRTEDEGIVVVGLPGFTPESKYKMMFALGLAFSQKKVRSVAFISEAWMVRTKEGQNPPKPPLSEHPEREEILVLVWGQKKGEYRSKMYVIEKVPDGPVFSEMEEPEKVESYLLDVFFDGLGRHQY